MLLTLLSKYPKEYVIAIAATVAIIDIMIASVIASEVLPEGKRIRFGFYKTTDKKG